MKHAILIAICIIALCSCKKDTADPGNHTPDYNDLTGTWIFVSFKDNVTGTISPRPASVPSNYSDPVITLLVKDANYVDFPDGASLLNYLGDGGFSIFPDKTIANFKTSVSQIFEPEWGSRFVVELSGIKRYFFTDINHLCFVTSSDTTLNFKRK